MEHIECVTILNGTFRGLWYYEIPSKSYKIVYNLQEQTQRPRLQQKHIIL